MIKFRRLLTVFIICLSVSGCKTIVETEVKLSELLSGKSKDIQGALYLEVASCSSYEDSRLESDSVTEAKIKVPQLFVGAEYKECFKKKFNSYASFSLPIRLSAKEIDGEFESNSTFSIFSKNAFLLVVGIPKSLNAKIDEFQKKNYAKSSDFKFNIKISNDTGEDHTFTALSSYINKKPYILNDNFSLKKGDDAYITLSDVSIDHARELNYAFVLMNNKK